MTKRKLYECETRENFVDSGKQLTKYMIILECLKGCASYNREDQHSAPFRAKQSWCDNEKGCCGDDCCSCSQMCFYLNYNKSKGCTHVVTMVPAVYCHVVARQAGGKVPFRCRIHSHNATTGDKSLDLSDIWKTRHGNSLSSISTSTCANQKTGIPSATTKSSVTSGFKRWRKTNRSVNNANNSEKNATNQNHVARDEEMSLLKFLAINALDLTAPASDILLKNRSEQWFQLAGHPDSLAPAGPGTVWKKRAGGAENTEREVYEALSADPSLRDIVPKYYREVEYNNEKFIELQDLLHGFQDPNVIDIKMGTRTFLESEVAKTTARSDLYEKMISVDPNAPTEEEHRQKAVTKLRYMQFREQQSSSSSQGFRIEAIKCRGSPPVKDLQKVKSRDGVKTTLAHFLAGREKTRLQIVERLKEIRTQFEQSEYFRKHEIIGSSIFMMYDDDHIGVWIIDFAKTNKVPDGIYLTHRKPWVQGNHEEGFLFGMDQLISMMEEIDFTQSHVNDLCNGNHNLMDMKTAS